MTDNVSSLALAIGNSILISVVVKATIVAAAGLLAVAAMRRVRASRRSLVLAWTFVVLAGLPVVALVARPLAVVVQETTVFMAPAPGVPPAAVPPAVVSGFSRTTQRPDAEIVAVPRPIPWEGLAGGVWAAGVFACLVPMMSTMRRLRLQRRAARVWRTGGPAVVLQHPDVSAPMTFGVVRPVILLPLDLSQWSDADIDRALVHEIEHVRRRDWLVHLFARFVCALYWFHPLVWRAWRRMYLEADRACDDAVVSGGSGQEFAEQLVALAGRVSPGAPTLAPSMAAGDLSRRVRAMVNPHQARGRSGAACARAVAVIAIAAGAAIAPATAVHATTILPLPVDSVPELGQSPFDQRSLVRAPSQIMTVVRPIPAAQRQSAAAPAALGPVIEIQASIADAAAEYTVGAGDVLEVSVYRQSELSREVLVRPDGKISLPLLGDVLAAGLTPDRLRERLTADMKRFIEDPRVTVALKQIAVNQATSRVFVVGEVMKPGMYPLVPPSTVLQQLALAGGFTMSASKGRIVVVRADGQRVPFDYNEFLRSSDNAQNTLLRPGDTVVVP